MECTRAPLVIVDAIALNDLMDLAERALPQLDDGLGGCLRGAIAQVRTGLIPEP